MPKTCFSCAASLHTGVFDARLRGARPRRPDDSQVPTAIPASPKTRAGRFDAAGFIRSGRLLLVVVDFAEFRIDDVVLGLSVAARAAVARRATRLLSLVHGFAKLHLRLHQVIGARLDPLDVL